MRTADFINTIGVNTHIPYTDGGYANIANVEADLAYLGVSNVRDTISNGYAGSAPLSSYIALAQQGIKFTIFPFGGGALTTSNIQGQLSLINQLEQAVPGSIVAVEGANEINNFPMTYNGVGGIQGAINLQKALYNWVHSNPLLTGVSVDYFTGYDAGGIPIGPNPRTTPGLADYDTQHPYPNNGGPPEQWVNRTQALPNEPGTGGPAVYTETGYSTNGGTSGAVNQDVQARYTLDLLMDDAQAGITYTYLYQLMDAYQPGSPQGDDGYGLFDPNNQPKEAATAIHNLTTVLADTGATASTFTPTAVTYSLANLPSDGNSMVMQKSNGATDIVVWAEPNIWNEATGTEVAAPAVNVTVSFSTSYQMVEIFDPLLGSAPIQTLYNVSSATIGVTDHPIIVELEPQTQPPPVDMLTLRINEDAWNGDAQFIVRVDGTQVGGTLSADVLRSTGDTGVFSLTGNWGSGAHNVQIQFINDGWGGTTTTDRNLFVSSIAYDGTTYANTSAKLFRNGTASFTVGGSTATAAPPPDALVVHLSEDAWNGDAQFVLSIDGKAISTPQAVTTLHSSGSWQDFTFAGSFGAGRHTIGVQFTNDAWGGVSGQDRNLYVNGIDINGQHVGAGVIAMSSAGTTNYTITTAA
ncbi:MAG: hypothetical protein JSR21_01320 [Proteobacteria bacterium]|nr:hypothetical protein [Pseudomonadota bacterium]